MLETEVEGLLLQQIYLQKVFKIASFRFVLRCTNTLNIKQKYSVFETFETVLNTELRYLKNKSHRERTSAVFKEKISQRTYECCYTIKCGTAMENLGKSLTFKRSEPSSNYSLSLKAQERQLISNS